MNIPKLENGTPSGKSSRAAEPCAQRATLSDAVAKAIREEYLRKKAYQDASTKAVPIIFGEVLQTARDALTRAVDALSKHIEDHACKK